MSNLTDFFPSGGGGGLTPKFEEFNASGTFTPSQALIDAGGYIEIFLVAGGARGSSAQGGEVLIKKMYLTNTSGCAVTIGAGTGGNNAAGGNSSFIGSSAGGNDLTALGGLSTTAAGNQSGYRQYNRRSPVFGAYSPSSGGAQGIFGYGMGAATDSSQAGIYDSASNTGQAAHYSSNYASASGYCLIKWYE